MSKVKIYTTTTCPWCQKTKTWLKSHKVSYVELNINNSEKARNEMFKKSNQMGVPVLDIGGNIIVGYDVEAIQNALKPKKEAKVKVKTAKKVKKKKGIFSFLKR